MTKWLLEHKIGPNQPNGVKNRPQNFKFYTGWRSNARLLNWPAIPHFLLNDPKVRFLRLKMVFPDHQVAPRPQKRLKLVTKTSKYPKTFTSALVGVPTAVLSTSNHSIFSLNNHKYGVKGPTCGLQITKCPPNFTFCSDERAARCYKGNQPSFSVNDHN